MKYFSIPQQWVLFSVAAILLGILYFKFYYQPVSDPSEEVVNEVVVEVSGEVRSPAVYVFKNPPTLGEAVERAGGLKESAYFDTTSSPETLVTGTLLVIEKGIQRDEIKIRISRMAADKCLALSIPLDLNRVSMGDLCLIPGIGESLAQEVIAYRQRRRGFRSVEELRNVRGIGEKKWKAIKNFLTVTQPGRVGASGLTSRVSFPHGTLFVKFDRL
jgi:competence protein ComEA